MTWIKGLTPKQVQNFTGIYRGQWMPEQDRCWIREEDGTCVMSRLVPVPKEFGEYVEHVTISRKNISADGSGGFTWAEKQQIKNELFGEYRTAVEVFPSVDRLVDTCDVYHLWVFQSDFKLPFGIHPDEYVPAVSRNIEFTNKDLRKLMGYYKKRDADDAGNDNLN